MSETLDEHIRRVVREAVTEALGPTASGEYMTRAEVAAHWRCSERHVDDRRRAGDLPAIRRGRAYVFSRSDVLARASRPFERVVVDPIDAAISANGLVPGSLSRRRIGAGSSSQPNGRHEGR